MYRVFLLFGFPLNLLWLSFLSYTYFYVQSIILKPHFKSDFWLVQNIISLSTNSFYTLKDSSLCYLICNLLWFECLWFPRCPPQILMLKSQFPKMRIIGGRDLWKWLDNEGEALTNEISVLSETSQRSPISSRSGDTVRWSWLWTRKRAITWTQHLYLGFLSLQNFEKNFCWL